MKKISKILLGILVVFYCYLFVRYRPWEAWIDRSRISDTVLASLVAIVLIGLVVCALALIAGRKGARKGFVIFNVLYLAFGLYVTYIAWTLWIFQKPTLFDRMKASTGPFLLGVILPIAVVIYFLKRGQK